MPEGKKDVLDFPLEEVSIPQAIALMMQAASKARFNVGVVGDSDVVQAESHVDNDRLQLLIEKLEAYVEDKIDLAAIPVVQPEPEEATDEEFEEAEPSDTFIQKNDSGDVYRVIHKGVVFGKLCNATVGHEGLEMTYCIKEWEHESLEHEDKNGAIR